MPHLSQATEAYLVEIRRRVSEAQQTDYIMPVWLAMLPAVLSVIAIIVPLIGLLAGAVSAETGEAAAAASSMIFLAALVIAAPLAIYVLYKLLKRRNEHFKRTHSLYDNIVAFLESLGIRDAEVVQMRNILNEMKYGEGEKSVGLWIILSLVTNLASLYVFHFLNKDFHRHEVREIMFFENLSSVFTKRGLPAVKMMQNVPDRNTILYIILTIITLGFFGIYWLYTLVVDPNRHFMEHRRVEQQLLSNLERIMASAAIGTQP